jgi:hypothetical protein
MAGAMHLYPFYWIYERSVKYIDKIVDTTLSLQQPDGLFNPVTGIGGSQCLDYDAIHILSNFYWFFPYRQKDITECLKKAGNALLVNHNPDGGFSHNRKEPETFGSGSKETAMKAGQSGLWETYARCLVLAMVSRIVPESSFSGPWHTGSNIMEMVDGLRKPIRSRVFKK